MGSSAAKSKKKNGIQLDSSQKKEGKLDPNSTDGQNIDPSPKSNNIEMLNNSQSAVEIKQISNSNGIIRKDSQKSGKSNKGGMNNVRKSSINAKQTLNGNQTPFSLNNGFDSLIPSQKKTTQTPLNTTSQKSTAAPVNQQIQRISNQLKQISGNAQPQGIEQAAPIQTQSIQIGSREKESQVQNPTNSERAITSLQNNVMRNKTNAAQERTQQRPHQQCVIEVASESDLQIVNCDLLKLVQDMQKQKEIRFQERQTVQFQEGIVAQGGGENFMEGSILDFFNVQQKNINEKRVQEIQESLRCDTDLLALVKQNISNGSMFKSIGFSPLAFKKRSLVGIGGIPLIRKCDSNNIQEDEESEVSIQMADDYNISPISRKHSVQMTMKSFGDFGFTSLAQIDKNADQSSMQHTNSDSSLDSSLNNTPELCSAIAQHSSEKFDKVPVNLPQYNDRHASEDSNSNNKEIKLIVKRQSSVRFMLPSNNLEKIKESDEKEEDMHTKTSNNDISPEKKRLVFIREKKLSSASNSGILKNFQKDDISQVVSRIEEDSNFDKTNNLIKDYCLDTENDVSESNSIPKNNTRLSEYSSNLLTLNTKDLNQRSSLFFNENAKLLDNPEKGKSDYLIEDSPSQERVEDFVRSPQSALERKNTYLSKRQSAYIKLEDLQKSPLSTEKLNNDINNNMLLQPNRLYHSTTMQAPQTPTAINTSNISNTSYITYFNKNPDQSVIETSYVKKEVDDNGYKKINSYMLKYELGRGGFGKVKLASAEFPTNEGVIQKEYAIKIANKQKLKRKLVSMKVNAYTLLEREVAIMKKIDHPHLVKLFEVIDDPEDDKIYMVMEYVQKGSIMSNTFWKNELKVSDPPLYQKIFCSDEDYKSKKMQDLLPKKLTEEKCRKYFQQFSLAIDYMHNYAQVIHRDIKPENILIDENDNLKIADFGVSHIMESNEDSEMRNNAGTQAFTAPEGWSRNFKGKPLDMWASGLTLYMMAMGELPFNTKDPVKLKNSILNDPVKIPEGTNPDLADFILKLLDKNPDTRLTASEMLKHPWLTLNGTVLLQNSDSSTKNIQISMEDLQGAFTKKIHLSTLIRVKFRLNRQLTRARSFLHANASGINLLDNSINQDRIHTDPNNQSPLKLPTNSSPKNSDNILQ